MSSEGTDVTQPAYERGMSAAMNGLEHWRNPYAGICCSSTGFHEWFAGWCYGMQQLNATKPD